MTVPDGLNQLGSVEVTIASGASLSGSADLKGLIPVGLDMPAAWTAAGLSFQGSDDNSTFHNIYNKDGEVSFSAAVADADRRVVIAVDLLIGCGRYIKVRSGVAATPVNQGADRVIKILCIPLV
jgi:hypothetical protein